MPRSLPLTPGAKCAWVEFVNEHGRQQLEHIGDEAAGVEPWARLWQTLRSSCEREWAMTFPAVRGEQVDRPQHRDQRQALRQRRARRTVRAGGEHGRDLAELRAAPSAAEGAGNAPK